MRLALVLGLTLLPGVLGLLATPAAAQTRGYSANRFDPSEPGGDWYTTESLDLRGALLPRAQIVGDWAYRPLRTHAPDGSEHRVLTDQVFVYLRAGLVLANIARVGIGLPIAIFQHGDGTSGMSRPLREQAFGDLRVSSDVRVFGGFEDHVRGAAGVIAYFPTGDRDAFTSDGIVRLAPRFMLAGAIAAFDWAARLGYLYRPLDRVWDGRALGDELTFGVSAGVKINDRLVLGPEVQGATTVTGPDAFGARSVPLELLLGARARLATHFQIGSAIGGGLTSADGTPKMRVLATFEFAPDVCVDKDGDGICAEDDACPDVDGVRTKDRKTNGCPIDDMQRPRL